MKNKISLILLTEEIINNKELNKKFSKKIGEKVFNTLTPKIIRKNKY